MFLFGCLEFWSCRKKVCVTFSWFDLKGIVYSLCFSRFLYSFFVSLSFVWFSYLFSFSVFLFISVFSYVSFGFLLYIFLYMWTIFLKNYLYFWKEGVRDAFIPVAAGSFLLELGTASLDGENPCTTSRRQSNILDTAHCYPHLPSNRSHTWDSKPHLT